MLVRCVQLPCNRSRSGAERCSRIPSFTESNEAQYARTNLHAASARALYDADPRQHLGGLEDGLVSRIVERNIGATVASEAKDRSMLPFHSEVGAAVGYTIVKAELARLITGHCFSPVLRQGAAESPRCRAAPGCNR